MNLNDHVSYPLGFDLKLWFRYIIIGMVLFVTKKIWIEIISTLFKYTDLKEKLLYDLISISLFFLIPFFFLIIIDFIIDLSVFTDIKGLFNLLLPTIMTLLIVKLILYYFRHPSTETIPFIIYLCAAELIPTVILFSWYYQQYF